jgi:hypothetical protein
MDFVICRQCGKRSEALTITKGSILIELVLWLFFLLPGIIYTIWRLTSKYKGCSYCNSGNIVSIYSPMGKKLAAEMDLLETE